MVSRVYVIGMGMGNPATLTREAHDALAESGLVIGSARLIDALENLPARKLSLVSPTRIAEELRAAPEDVASVVMSGDVGFYSGSTGLYPLLEGPEVRTIPGVSSLSYLCARLQTTWQDAFVVSAHGRAHNAVGAVRTHAKTFLLTGGASSAQDICAQLVAHGLGEVRVHVGERLSYDDERIVTGTARELAEHPFESLAVMLVLNDSPLVPEVRAPELPDDAFARGKVPMTKQEVRQLAICKLRIRPTDTVWDVGAGTGSVSVEAARAACEGQVLAIERNPEAVALIEANRARYGLSNLQVVQGAAPEALEGLDAPDRVFVGGSSGSLDGILRAALAANPAVRLCVTAITLETVADVLACVRALDLRNVDICQVSIAKAHEAGAYHLMQAQNPVYLIVAEGPGEAATLDAGGL